MPLAFDMDTDDSVVSVVTMKRKPVGITAKVISKGSGPVADPKAACSELGLADFAVVETTDDHKRARAVLVALSNGATAAVLVPPSLEKAAVKKAYTTEQGSTKVLVPWTKLTAMAGAAWLGPHMTISEALRELTKPKPRPPKVAEPAALPAVEVPVSSPVKLTKKPRKIAPTPITPEHVSETESDGDSCDTDEEEEEDNDSDEQENTDGDVAVEETDAETEAETESEDEALPPAKRSRIFDVTAVCSDEMETRKITARFEVHGQDEMNRVFESFRNGGVV